MRLASTNRYDVLVVGAGPAGSIAALVLARAGARVALVDKASFPRDKACGDLIGPRGVQTLRDLGVELPGLRVGDMEVIGPTGRRVVLRARPGTTYPGHGVSIRRSLLDDTLRQSAVDAGAESVTGRAADPVLSDAGELDGFDVEMEKGRAGRLRADVVIGADGALSRVGVAAGLVNETRVIWGFTVRAYLEGEPTLPRIHFWEPARWAGYPGYGWVFPTGEGRANVGLGIGARGSRRTGARAARDLGAFATAAGYGASRIDRTLGGWLKMGMVGTTPAHRRTLLVGDAAGLVNSLQGEGISQALGSGQAAARAIIEAGPEGAAAHYVAALARAYAPFAANTAPVTAWMLKRPRAVAGIGRALTAPGVGRSLAGGWSVYWNDLLDGAVPGSPRRVAALADRMARRLTASGCDHRSVWESVTSWTGGSERLS